MNKFKLSILVLSAIVAMTSLAGCGKSNNSDGSVILNHENSTTELPTNKVEQNVTINEPVDSESTTFVVNSVVDINKTTEDNEKYIFINYTIKNNSDKDISIDRLNNFYIIVDGKKVFSDVRASSYAQKSINGYINIESVKANEEITNYIGFVIPSNTTNFTFGYYPSIQASNDRSTAVVLDVSSSDFIAPPEGMLK